VTTTPYDVVEGLNNRLYVFGGSPLYQISQIDATTGATTGPSLGAPGNSYGYLQISPDQQTLYLGTTYSASYIYSYDVSTTSIAPLHSVQSCEDAKGLVLSHNGLTIAQVNGFPYCATLFQSSDLTALGQFNTGAYPDALAFSPDDQLAYVLHSPYPTAVDIYSTTTFADLGQFKVADDAYWMATDHTGTELFVACDGQYNGNSNLIVYSAAPEPSTLALLLAGFVGLLAYACRRRRKLHNLPSMILPAMVVLAAGSAQADVFNMGGTRDPVTGAWTGQASLEFVTVGNPGNAADTTVMSDGTTGYGSVPYTYQMGKYDVTVGQYTAFLNAVAKTDTYGLYNSYMAPGSLSNDQMPTIGIAQSGSSGSYSYSVTGGYSQAANCPIVNVSWGDAARFCNWLQNGQPTSGVENASTTENGAYTLNGATSYSAMMAITRNAGATYVIPTENEWYKAAYYDPTLNGGAGGYWGYPTKSNPAPDNSLALAATEFNDANYQINGNYTDPTNYLTPVGTFAASPGAYGTYDMGGDINQWNETNVSGYRGIRGGSFYDYSLFLASSLRDGDVPTNGFFAP
jgi:formylglycine-generating enzyme required for sulfatase activity